MLPLWRALLSFGSDRAAEKELKTDTTTITIMSTIMTITAMITTAIITTDRMPTTIITGITMLKVKSAPPAVIPMRRIRP